MGGNMGIMALNSLEIMATPSVTYWGKRDPQSDNGGGTMVSQPVPLLFLYGWADVDGSSS